MSERQLALVIDLNKCFGCHTCSVACKTLWTNDKGMDHQWWAMVNTLPGGGYPKGWETMGGGYSNGHVALGKRPTMEDYGGVMEFNYAEVFYGGKGQQTYLKPKQPVTWGPNWDEDLGAGEWPNSYFFYLPRLCNHCTKPSCAEACPFGAITKRAQDGIVQISEPQKCETCTDKPCMQACPYKVIFENTRTAQAQKCNGCAIRVDEGVAPACARQCPGRCIWVGYLDGTESQVPTLVTRWKVALPLHPEFGTKPNIYYVPPLAPPAIGADGNPDHSKARIPLDYLKGLFGPGVEEALKTLQEEMAKRQRGEPSELMDILIAYRWPSLMGPFAKDPSEVKVS